MSENDVHELPNCKDMLARMGPLDTLLGSVSYSDTDSVEGKTQQIRTSARVFKKMKYDLSHNVTPEKKEKKDEPKPEDIKQETVKKPAVTQWSAEETSLFFEALNEFGKDFESIYAYINTRLKKRGAGDDAGKNKYQIRNFYYKTYHSIENELKFYEHIPKNALELYALINYGEIKKKSNASSKKWLKKLHELIETGSTLIRTKGKGVKIKTPMCRALRRLNQLDEKYDDLKLPTRVLVELRPQDMASFVRVQSMAQNPRIKIALPLQKRLSSLINCINSRWRTTEAILYDNALVSGNVATNDCIPDQKTIEEKMRLLTPSLRLAPPRNANVELPSIDISEYFSGQSICLNAFLRKKGAQVQKEDVKKEDLEKCGVKVEEGAICPNLADETPLILKLKTSEIEDNCDTIIEKVVNDNNNTDTNNKESKTEERLAIIGKIREGWTTENCDSLTIGELYLMFGSDSKLLLEYSWDQSHKGGPDQKCENQISTPLKTLLSLAKIHAEKSSKCTCGHVCGSLAKSTTQFKRPVSTKLLKKDNPSEDSEMSTNMSISKQPNVSNLKVNPIANLFNQFESKLHPKCRNKGKPRCKQLVVERSLVPTKSEAKHQIVSMNIVAQENKPLEGAAPSTSFSNEEEGAGKDFSGILHGTQESSMTGLSKILKENENQWNVNDYSLSSLLRDLDGAGKTNQSAVSLLNTDSQLPDVEVQLQTLFSETSVDYTAKFADLAAKVVDKK